MNVWVCVCACVAMHVQTWSQLEVARRWGMFLQSIVLESHRDIYHLFL